MVATPKKLNVFPTTIPLLKGNYVLSRALSAASAETITLPPSCKYVLFSATADFYVQSDGTAATVPADVTDGSAAELNPVFCDVGGVATLSVIAPATCVVTVTCFLAGGQQA